MHRLIDPQSLDVRPVEHGGALPRHLLRRVESRELDVLRAGGWLEAREELAEGEADPRHHQRPRLDAAEAIDALLERLSLEEVLEVEPAAHLGLARDRHAPGSGAHHARIFAGRFLVGAELVEVVVGGDLVVSVGLLAHRIARVPLVGERRAGGLAARGANAAARGARQRRGEQRAAAEIDLRRRDLGRRYGGWTRGHCSSSSLGQ